MTTTKSNNVMNTVANLSTACIKLFNLVKVAKADAEYLACRKMGIKTFGDISHYATGFRNDGSIYKITVTEEKYQQRLANAMASGMHSMAYIYAKSKADPKSTTEFGKIVCKEVEEITEILATVEGMLQHLDKDAKRYAEHFQLNRLSEGFAYKLRNFVIDEMDKENEKLAQQIEVMKASLNKDKDAMEITLKTKNLPMVIEK